MEDIEGLADLMQATAGLNDLISVFLSHDTGQPYCLSLPVMCETSGGEYNLTVTRFTTIMACMEWAYCGSHGSRGE